MMKVIIEYLDEMDRRSFSNHQVYFLLTGTFLLTLFAEILIYLSYSKHTSLCLFHENKRIKMYAPRGHKMRFDKRK